MFSSLVKMNITSPFHSALIAPSPAHMHMIINNIHISFMKGDLLYLLADEDAHWLYVAETNSDKCGFVPRKMMEPAVSDG